MVTRRRPRGSIQDLLPDDRLTWARETWEDRKEVAKLDGGAWLLREAAKVLGYSEETVDDLLRCIEFSAESGGGACVRLRK